MKQRQSSSHVKSWIFVWLVSSAEVWFSQRLTAFPLNRDTGVVQSRLKEGFKCFLNGFLFCFVFLLFCFPCLSVRTETELKMPVSDCHYGL